MYNFLGCEALKIVVIEKAIHGKHFIIKNLKKSYSAVPKNVDLV